MCKRSLQDLFQGQFAGPYFLGTSIADGWLPIVLAACQQIQDTLTSEELERFSWAQIKEKFGGLCLYWHSNQIPVSAISRDGAANFEVKVGPDDEVLDRIAAKVQPIIADAQRKASKTCEICGGPGYLRPGGYWQTLCDRHAAEEGKELPPFGVALHSRQTGRKHHEGNEIVSNAGVALRDQAIRTWQVGEKEMVFVKDLLPTMVDQVFATTGRPMPEMIEFHELVDILRARPDGVPTILNSWLQHPEGAVLTFEGRVVKAVEEKLDDQSVENLHVVNLPGKPYRLAAVRTGGALKTFVARLDPEATDPRTPVVLKEISSEDRQYRIQELADEYRAVVDNLIALGGDLGVDKTSVGSGK